MLILFFIFHLVFSDQSYAECIGQRSPLGILFWYYFFEVESLTDPLNAHRLSGQWAPGTLLCPPPQQQDCISYRIASLHPDFNMGSVDHLTFVLHTHQRLGYLPRTLIAFLTWDDCLQYRIEALSTTPLPGGYASVLVSVFFQEMHICLRKGPLHSECTGGMDRLNKYECKMIKHIFISETADHC